mmetsp:Transcript_17906/g.36771  ORF Transcript_17906/g.36771 Transcript_17906/m.36771 type:complete len:257 (+) Transcript_17906:221-991(+)
MLLRAPISFLSLVVLALVPSMATSFVIGPRSAPPSSSTSTSSELSAIYTPGRSASRNNRSGRDERSKRQFRVGEFVRTELATILHTGLIKGDASYLEQDLRQRISIVSVDVSPDLRQARVSVSIRGFNKRRNNNSNNNNNSGDAKETEAGGESSETMYYEDDPVVDKRRAFSWLVDNTKPIRHTLAQRMSHMKTSPDLTFHQVDVAAATDVMYLIDKVSKGYERESIGEYEFLGEFDEDDDDEEWDEVDDDFFETE